MEMKKSVIFFFSSSSASFSATSLRFSKPRFTISRSSSGVKGLGRKSYAPFFMDATAYSIVA